MYEMMIFKISKTLGSDFSIRLFFMSIVKSDTRLKIEFIVG